MENPSAKPEPQSLGAPVAPFVSKTALAMRWALVVLPAVAIALVSPPQGIEIRSWQLFAIFVATILGLMFQPLPGGAMVLLGIAATALFGVLEPATALAGYADPVVWMVVAAIMLARGMIKTGLGRRFALHLVRALGGTSLGLGYALALTDGTLASVIPSNSARAGGILFPITRSIAESYGSQPGPTAGRLGAFLLPLVYQTDVIVCAMFLTGAASNPLIAGFTREATGIELTYGTWFLGALLPGLVSLLLTPLFLHRLFPPEVRRTPQAADYGAAELRKMGPLGRSEILMLGTFLLVLTLWVTTRWHGIDYTLVAMLGLAALLVTRVLTWEDVITERSAWDVFIWYGGLVLLARELGKTGITERFAQGTGGLLEGWSWPLSLAVLLLVYFYAHYAFASITAHSSAMLVPFLSVSLVAGAPPMLAALLFAYLSNLCACLTHYGTTPAPIYFGAGYVTQARWWQIGLAVSGPHLVLWPVVGLVWWKLLGWW